MIDLESKIRNLKFRIKGGLIVSCQAPANSPLAKPEIIAALAEVAEQNRSVAVRIDSPSHIKAVKQAVRLPIFGIYKIVSGSSEVYITPTFDSARTVAEAGADVIAIDATLRRRPSGERLTDIIRRIEAELNTPVMADVATLEEGINAAEKLGVDFISTTLSGYTSDTKHIAEPDFDLVEKLVVKVGVPVICEGRLRSPEDARRAFDCGAFAVVVGGAITGVDQLVQRFVSVMPAANAAIVQTIL